MMEAALALAVTAAVARTPSAPSEMCQTPAALVEQVTRLRDNAWTEWTPKRLGETWGPLTILGRTSRRNWPSTYQRQRRVDAGRLECDEVYHFDVTPQQPPYRDQLYEVVLIHTEASRDSAFSVARAMAEAVQAPTRAGRGRVACFDCGDPGEVVLDAGWDVEGHSNDVQISVKRESAACRVVVQWWQRVRAVATPSVPGTPCPRE